MRPVMTALAMAAVLVAAGACSGETNEVGDPTRRSTTTEADRDDPEAAADPESPAASGPVTTSDPGPESGAASTSDDGTTGAGSSGRASTAPGARGGNGTGPSADPGTGTAPPTTSPVPATTFPPDPGRYQDYVRRTKELGGDIASLIDATALASVFCTDPVGSAATYLGGEPLGTYPSDLALVRAYCPEQEARFGPTA